jgi:phosphopantothenoylcysteine decarboxylase/phosphopantothenate--cysteine ligase
MLRTIEQFLPETDALIMAAAVADFRPMTMATQKIKKSSNPDEGLTIQLGRTADILLQVKEIRQQTGFPHVVVGFAAESQDLLTNAQSKLERKSLDMIVANDILASDAGFGVDTNRVIILEKNGHQTRTELLSKSDIGDLIVQKVGALLQSS